MCVVNIIHRSGSYKLKDRSFDIGQAGAFERHIRGLMGGREVDVCRYLYVNPTPRAS